MLVISAAAQHVILQWSVSWGTYVLPHLCACCSFVCAALMYMLLCSLQVLFVIPDMSYKLLELLKAEAMSETHLKDPSKAWLTVFEGRFTWQFNNNVIQYPSGAV